MATAQARNILQHVHSVVLNGTGLTDGQLLESYLSRRDEAAIAALVRRHGNMVWGVCRRVLPNHHDAEDAFQATFLVLVRKATSIVPREMVANWLYGVAHQTALKARAMKAKRKAREGQVINMPEPQDRTRNADCGMLEWEDVQPLLDEELSRLPDKYRVAIVLCDLEGKTRSEAARQLGVPDGTLAARVARGRVVLAKRLARRGVAVPGGVLAAILGQGASAAVPTAVVTSTMKATSLFAAGRLAEGVVVSLVDGVLKTMLFKKLKTTAGLLLAVALAVGTAALAYTQATPPGAPQSTTPSQVATPDEKKETTRDIDKLQGTWNLLSAEMDGLRIGESRPELKDNRLVIDKNKLTLHYTERSEFTPTEVKAVSAEFSIDEKPTPKVVTLTWKESLWTKQPGSKHQAIYELKGDSLIICLTQDDEKAPPEFSANYGSKRLLWTFKRATER